MNCFRRVLFSIPRKQNAMLETLRYGSSNVAKPLRPVKPKSQRPTQQSFIDMRQVRAKGGKGGDGAISFLQLWVNDRAGPDGGDGGNGGHVVLQVSNDVYDLRHVHRLLIAEDGERGGTRDCFGKNARHTVVKVPRGTIVRNSEGKIIADLNEMDMMFIAARGGAGGHGNSFFVSDTQQTPMICEYGADGEETEYLLEVRSMAHMGLVSFGFDEAHLIDNTLISRDKGGRSKMGIFGPVCQEEKNILFEGANTMISRIFSHGFFPDFKIGLPNAGKSTLLQAISRARPKIAPYPFTTLQPQVGIVTYDDYEQIAVADLPGLVSGSHKNRGLGTLFLKHAERCTALLFIIDIAQDEPWTDLETLMFEIEQFSSKLVQRPMLVIANKMDLPQAQDNLEAFKSKLKAPVIPISAKMGTNVTSLLQEIRQLYNQSKEKDRTSAGEEDSL